MKSQTSHRHSGAPRRAARLAAFAVATASVIATPTLQAATGGDGAPLAVHWIHGQANCAHDPDPAFQVYQLNADTMMLRQDKCLEYEAPFIYLLFGAQKTLMLDTGSISVPYDLNEDQAKSYPLRLAVDQILKAHAAATGGVEAPLLVVHTHGHEDHIAGDALFYTRANTQVIDPGVSNVMSFWGFTDMQGAPVSFDLGGRVLDVLPLPGHLEDHIAIYDRSHAVLLAGDSLYPGRLYIDDWDAYRQSISRLTAFLQDKPVAYVLGAHIEMSRTPRVDYRIGSTYQPNEHVLELYARHLTELNTALQAIGPTPRYQKHDEFIIDP